MRVYVITTGAIFGLIVVAHIWRMVAEDSHLLKDPLFVLLTVVAGGLCFWAWRLVRRAARP